MSEISGKNRKRYVDHPKDRSKPTCLIHGPRHSSDERKVLGDLGSKYAKISPTKDPMHGTANRNKFNSQKQNNAIVNHTVDEILLQENNKVRAEEKAQENIDSELDENDIYHIDNMSLDYNKEEKK